MEVIPYIYKVSAKRKKTATMKNWTSKILILLSLMTFSHYANCQSFSTFVESINSYQNQVKLKRQEEPKHIIIDSTTFNLSSYFGMFDKLEIKPNLKLYYVFCDFATYGQPALYVKHDSVIIENFIEQYLDKYYKECGGDKTGINEDVNDFRREEILFHFAEDSINKAIYNIIPYDSKVGYLQYLYFYTFGENFVLFWHSNINKGNVIFSKNEMRRLFDIYMSNEDYTVEYYEYKILKDLLKNRFKPKIKKTKDKYIITWYENFLHLGIYKRTYMIERQPPFKIAKINDEKIVSPHYGVIY